MERICKGCKKTKEITDYHKDKNCTGGYRTRCKVCWKNKIPIIPDPVPLSKQCTSCKKEKLMSEFGNRNGKSTFKHGKNSICKSCHAIKNREWLFSNPEKLKKFYEVNKKWRDKNPDRYKGIIFPSKWKSLEIIFTKEMYYTLLEKQNHVCAICGQKENNKGSKNLSVDHCHKTKKVRGLLCGNCNRGIGLLKDNSDILFNAAIYLENNK